MNKILKSLIDYLISFGLLMLTSLMLSDIIEVVFIELLEF